MIKSKNHFRLINKIGLYGTMTCTDQQILRSNVKHEGKDSF